MNIPNNLKYTNDIDDSNNDDDETKEYVKVESVGLLRRLFRTIW